MAIVKLCCNVSVMKVVSEMLSMINNVIKNVMLT